MRSRQLILHRLCGCKIAAEHLSRLDGVKEPSLGLFVRAIDKQRRCSLYMRRFWLNDEIEDWRILSASSSVFLRLALGFTFLSSVADRFGLWGAFGEPNVAWGTFARFVAYTGKLNWLLPGPLIPTLAVVATGAEIIFGILLLLGWRTRITALLSGALLLLFAGTMTLALGIKAPLDFSVFVDAGAAFLLATCAEYPFSIDHLLSRKGLNQPIQAITSTKKPANSSCN